MPSLNPALANFWTQKTVADPRTGVSEPIRNRVLHGGRASSKSWDAAGFATYLATNFQVKFLCVRQFQNRITDSVYSLLKIQIERFQLRDQFAIQKRTITSDAGAEFMFYGLARNIEEIKSIESVDILWIEEANTLTAAQWEILEPTIRKEGSQVWLTFNPGYVTDFVWQRFVVSPPPGTLVRQINYNENPFLSRTMHRIIRNAFDEDEESARHVYLGEPRTDNPTAVIKRSWVEAAIGAVEKIAAKDPDLARTMRAGGKVVGFDVADGSDEEMAPNDHCANVLRIGSVATWCDEWKAGEDEIPKSCARTYKTAQLHGASIRYDSIGVGASAGGKFDELNELPANASKRVRYLKFNAGGGVFKPEAMYVADAQQRISNEDYFSNIKAQAWWLVADRFRNTYDYLMNGNDKYTADELIAIDPNMPHLEKLKTELSTPKRDFDANGRVKVESKKDLAKREIASPNLADAFIMAYAPGDAPMVISRAAIAKAAARG